MHWLSSSLLSGSVLRWGGSWRDTWRTEREKVFHRSRTYPGHCMNVYPPPAISSYPRTVRSPIACVHTSIPKSTSKICANLNPNPCTLIVGSVGWMDPGLAAYTRPAWFTSMFQKYTLCEIRPWSMMVKTIPLSRRTREFH